ncbi:hypothetical protein MASR1M32_23610 [Rhodobacter sp.]
MWDFSLSQAFGQVMRGAGALAQRLLVFLAIALALVLASLILGWVGHIIGYFGSGLFQIRAGYWGAVLGTAIAIGALFFLRDHLLFHVTAPHALVLAGQAPDLTAARQQVAGTIGLPAPLMVLDLANRRALHEITGLLGHDAVPLPVAGLETSPRVARFWLNRAESQLDMVLLTQVLRAGTKNPFAAMQAALVRHASAATVILANASWLVVLRCAVLIPAFLVLLAPAAALARLLPVGDAGAVLVFGTFFTWALKAALVDPLEQACLLQLLSGDAAEPDAEVRAALAEGSRAFQTLETRAASWATVLSAP